MTEPLPDVVHLPPPKPGARPPLHHALGDAVTIAPENSISGYEQKEKTCKNCGAVRVTILDPARNMFWRAWRRTAEGEQIETDIPPPCDAEGAWPG